MKRLTGIFGRAMLVAGVVLVGFNAYEYISETGTFREGDFKNLVLRNGAVAAIGATILLISHRLRD